MNTLFIYDRLYQIRQDKWTQKQKAKIISFIIVFQPAVLYNISIFSNKIFRRNNRYITMKLILSMEDKR